jgi:hypothetical protein
MAHSDGPEYKFGKPRHVAQLLATMYVEPYDELIAAIITAQVSDPLAVDVSAKLVEQAIRDGTDTAKEERQWNDIVGVLTYEERIFIPATDSLCGKAISQFLDNPKFGHFGALRPSELVSRDFYWPAIDSCVRKDVSGCEECHPIKSPRHAEHGINMPLETASRPWDGVPMDFVTDLS